MLPVLLTLRFQNSKFSGKRNSLATGLDHIHMPSPKAQLFLLEALASNVVQLEGSHLVYRQAGFDITGHGGADQFR